MIFSNPSIASILLINHRQDFGVVYNYKKQAVWGFFNMLAFLTPSTYTT